MRYSVHVGVTLCAALLPLLATAGMRERRRFDYNWQFCLPGARKAVPALGHAEWLDPYVPGTLLAQGHRNGLPFGRDIVATTGAASSIVLSCDATDVSHDPENLLCVTVELRDMAGRRVPTDSSGHEPFNGLATVSTTVRER